MNWNNLKHPYHYTLSSAKAERESLSMYLNIEISCSLMQKVLPLTPPLEGETELLHFGAQKTLTNLAIDRVLKSASPEVSSRSIGMLSQSK